ncbi:peptidoglycan N-acetylglucosamine deacetylase [Bacillus manliponensis]|uniref:Peptidoglycan N-acetylglucosamine deacetylase n=1 Tax=Bacillus manliponensis TaxID=574376 RepID=A0A073KGD7_9BACI|nr:polysaccharide deacetylase family protein [Bacillus manliponensis]KEK21363.1 peptidoglycan N-acetylglucosamine deacetylase [Bacillus manliponensis]
MKNRTLVIFFILSFCFVLHTPVFASEKVAYLTFDDGPNKYTPMVLDILKKKNVHATFFVIGGRIARSPETMDRIVREGHSIGLHSMSHDVKRLYNGDPFALVAEMEQTRTIVRATTGLDSQLVRVPYGSMPYLKEDYRNALVKEHYKMWDWTIDTYDWKSNGNPSNVVQRLINQTDEEIEVVLMHDSAVTVKALPQIIDYLHSQGYTLLPYDPSSHIKVNFWKDKRL